MENSGRKTGSKKVAPKSKTRAKTRVTTTEVRARAIRTRARASSRTEAKASRKHWHTVHCMKKEIARDGQYYFYPYLETVIVRKVMERSQSHTKLLQR